MKQILILAIVLTLATAASIVEEKYKYYLFSEECFKEIFEDNNFFNVKCLSKILSKSLSLAIVSLSLILKVPQILKIAGNKTVKGLSFESLFFEGILYSFTIAYNYRKGNDFMLYGENVFILIQAFVIVGLFKIYDRSLSSKGFFIRVGLFFLVNVPLYTPLVPIELFDLTIYINMILLLGARLPQIGTNWKNQHTGQLAFVTVFLSFAGALARGYTLVISGADLLFTLYNFEGIFLNGTLLFQILSYWKNKPAKSD